MNVNIHEGHKWHNLNVMTFVQLPYKKQTFLIYFVSCSFDYLMHSKECEEI